MSGDLTTSNSIADLRERAKAEHAAVAASMRTSLGHAFAAGDLLIEAKLQLNHGQWLPWLDSCGIPERTAQRYIRLARNRQMIEAKSDTVSDLGVNGALALLTLSKTRRRDSMADDAAKIAFKATDTAFTWDQFEREERERIAYKPQYRKQRELIAEAKSALDKVGELLAAEPDLAKIVDRFFEGSGSRFCAACADYKSARLTELGLTEEAYEHIVAEAKLLERKGATEQQILWHVFSREFSEFEPRPGVASASITAIACTVRNIAIECLRCVQAAASDAIAESPP
jgi:hypothetical protein